MTMRSAQATRAAAMAAGLLVLSGCAAPPPLQNAAAVSATPEVLAVHQQWQPVTLDFAGPQLSETGELNPFTDTRLIVTYTKGTRVVSTRGFFAADGNAGETGADSGNIWRARFMPDEPGEWSYSARLEQGADIALATGTTSSTGATPKSLGQWQGRFAVAPPESDARGFYATGKLTQDGQYFRTAQTGKRWLKGGANSPENLLAFADFDGTYRMSDNARDGEADAGGDIHSFAPHIRDWRAGDPTWQDGKGKGLIGAVNYLADQGMNAVYFLTYNVAGDGKDVWPWASPDDPTRFDVSKLAQWETVFAHMQARGVALHIVLQETENELLLDGGDTGPQRQLYLNELIARFAHHPALFWNLGEENGPVHWRPEGQNDAQRKAMAQHIAANDPYGHPVLLHTHSEGSDKDTILTPLLGELSLAGLSFQVSKRMTVNAEVRKWIAASREAGRPWAITMDEIGEWQIGARADKHDPMHDSLRQHALWGTLLGGGAGVEWYFGAHQDGNDLTTEDWRSRAELWRQTRIALRFFEENLEYWDMQPCAGDAYCLTDAGRSYAIYWSDAAPKPGKDVVVPGHYRVRLFDPVAGIFVGDRHAVKLTSSNDLKRLIGPSIKEDRVFLLDRVDAQ